MLTFTIVVRPVGRGKFEAYHGSDLLCVSTEPLCEASRVLLSRGLANTRDTIEMYHESCATASLRSKVGKAARLTVKEDGRDGVRFSRVNGPLKPVRSTGDARNESPRYTPSFA